MLMLPHQSIVMVDILTPRNKISQPSSVMPFNIGGGGSGSQHHELAHHNHHHDAASSLSSSRRHRSHSPKSARSRNSNYRELTGTDANADGPMTRLQLPPATVPPTKMTLKIPDCFSSNIATKSEGSEDHHHHHHHNDASSSSYSRRHRSHSPRHHHHHHHDAGSSLSSSRRHRSHSPKSARSRNSNYRELTHTGTDANADGPMTRLQLPPATVPPTKMTLKIPDCFSSNIATKSEGSEDHHHHNDASSSTPSRRYRSHSPRHHHHHHHNDAGSSSSSSRRHRSHSPKSARSRNSNYRELTGADGPMTRLQLPPATVPPTKMTLKIPDCFSNNVATKSEGSEGHHHHHHHNDASSSTPSRRYRSHSPQHHHHHHHHHNDAGSSSSSSRRHRSHSPKSVRSTTRNSIHGELTGCYGPKALQLPAWSSYHYLYKSSEQKSRGRSPTRSSSPTTLSDESNVVNVEETTTTKEQDEQKKIQQEQQGKRQRPLLVNGKSQSYLHFKELLHASEDNDDTNYEKNFRFFQLNF